MFDEDYYTKMLKTADNFGMSIIPLSDAVKVLAVVYSVNEEAITHSPKAKCEVGFLQDKYHLEGGEVPDAEFVKAFQPYAREMDNWYDNKCPFPEWGYEVIKRRYDFNLKV